MLMKYPLRQTTLALRSPQGEVRPGRWRIDEGDISFIIVFRLVRDVVANHKTTRYAGAATKVIQKNHLA